jgi:hypothetical protein
MKVVFAEPRIDTCMMEMHRNSLCLMLPQAASSVFTQSQTNTHETSPNSLPLLFPRTHSLSLSLSFSVLLSGRGDLREARKIRCRKGE